MNVVQSTKEGHCPLCDQDVSLGETVISYLSSWSHEACVIADLMTRTSHSEGVTYFLELQGSRIKVGFSASEKGVKQRIRRAHLDHGGVLRILGLLEGGQTLEFRMHYTFREHSTGVNEIFDSHPHILATARQGAGHPYMLELNDYLKKQRSD